MAFSYQRPHADVFVPDGHPITQALARTTDLAVGAHQDDLELAALAPIVACRDDPERWFTGVVCTDGAGGARNGPLVGVTDDEMCVLRTREQRAAAEIGGFGAVLQLGHTSAGVRGDGHAVLVAELAEIMGAARTVNLYTHDLADRHPTHVAVAAATVEAVRLLAVADRPWRLVGIEGWRDLDWLDDDEKVLLDTSGHAEFARHLAAAFASQMEGDRRYDLGAEGRRRANATFLRSGGGGGAGDVSFAMDLTPLVHNPELDPVVYTTAAIDRFKADVTDALRSYFPSP